MRGRSEFPAEPTAIECLDIHSTSREVNKSYECLYVIDLVALEVVVKHDAGPQTAQYKHDAEDRRKQSELYEHYGNLGQFHPVIDSPEQQEKSNSGGGGECDTNLKHVQEGGRDVRQKNSGCSLGWTIQARHNSLQQRVLCFIVRVPWFARHSRV